MHGVNAADPISKVSNQSRKPGPIRRNETDYEHRNLADTEMKVQQITNLGLKKRIPSPADHPIKSHHGPELPHGPRRMPEASFYADERGIRPKPVPIREDLSQPHGPHRKADPDFYREGVDPAAVPREQRKPIEVTSNNAQTLMYVPKGPHRRSDRHWEQVPESEQTRGHSGTPDKKAPGRAPEREDGVFQGQRSPPYITRQNEDGHKFYKQNEEGNWERSQKAAPPEPVLKIRRANESSIDMPLNKPAERYTRQMSNSDGAPGHREERILDPSIHHSLHQKGYRKFRDRGWYQDESVAASISPRVRAGTAVKPTGFNLPNYDHLGKNDPVTRMSARQAREALQYPEERKHNQESKDQPLPDPRANLDY